jgi:hypothetical protein
LRRAALCRDGRNAAGAGWRTVEHIGEPGFDRRQHAIQSASAIAAGCLQDRHRRRHAGHERDAAHTLSWELRAATSLARLLRAASRRAGLAGRPSPATWARKPSPPAMPPNNSGRAIQVEHRRRPWRLESAIFLKKDLGFSMRQTPFTPSLVLTYSIPLRSAIPWGAPRAPIGVSLAEIAQLQSGPHPVDETLARGGRARCPHAMPRCALEAPPLARVEGRMVACHLYG